MNTQQQDFEKLFRSELEKVNFEIPLENAHHLIPAWKKLMEVSSLYHLDCDFEVHGILMNELVQDEPKFNLYTVSFLINALGKTSPKDLGIDSGAYHLLLFYSNDLSKDWNEKVLPVRDKLVNKMRTQEALQMPKKT